MKTALRTFVISFLLMLTGALAGAQSPPTVGSFTLPEGVQPAANWLNVFQQTFGADVSAHWMLELIDRETTILQTPGHSGLILIRKTETEKRKEKGNATSAQSTISPFHEEEDVEIAELPGTLRLVKSGERFDKNTQKASFGGEIAGKQVNVERILVADQEGTYTEILWISSSLNGLPALPESVIKLAAEFAPGPVLATKE